MAHNGYNPTMTATTAPNHLSLAAQLPAGAYYYLMHTLRGTLPRLLTNTPENRARRDESAVARVAALCPANIAEAEVSALHVTHAEHAKAAGLTLHQSRKPRVALVDDEAEDRLADLVSPIDLLFGD